MNRIDNSRFLLYIEPKKEEKLEIPINDEITKIMKNACSEAEYGVSNYDKLNETENFISGFNDYGEIIKYYGFHETDCGVLSDCFDYLLKNGMITNSLCVFYLKYYRNTIPKSEMDKVMELISFYKK